MDVHEEFQFNLSNVLLQPERLTAAHYLAYKWVVSRIDALARPISAMDFGARYSLLPSILALRGQAVVAGDRDPQVGHWQGKCAQEYGVVIDTLNWKPSDGIAPDLKFDVITACWAIQHNGLDEQSRIVKTLASALAPGGKLLIVAAFTPDNACVYDTKREDPLWRLNVDGVDARLVHPSGLKLTNQIFFSYEHNTTTGGFCDPIAANAVAVELSREVVTE